jgi:RNA polymerase sigma-70 factor (ECF subfamily)
MSITSRQEKIAAQWVHEHSDELYGFAFKRLRDHEAARDLVQETLLAAWRNVDAYDPEQPLRAWLFAILRNKLIDQFRKTARQNIEWESLDDRHFFDDVDHWKKGAYPQNWQTRQVMEQKEFWAILQSCRNKLKQLQQVIFTMKYIDDEDSAAICEALEITQANYWVLMHRAKLQLRSCLEKNWFSK